jgi:hypothetical protein
MPRFDFKRRFYFKGILLSSFLVIILVIANLISPVAFAQQISSINNLLNAFDFNQRPHPPHVIPLTAAQLTAISPFINLVRIID